jgi:hypothetical protein
VSPASGHNSRGDSCPRCSLTIPGATSSTG